VKNDHRTNHHGTKTGWKNYGCRCDLCATDRDQYLAERTKIAQARRQAERDNLPAMPEIRVTVSCLDCGGMLHLLAAGRVSASGARTQAMLKCGSCGHEWLSITLLQSKSGKEFE